MSPDVQYLVASSAWSVGGLVVGYLFGRMERDLTDIKRKLNERNDR